ncbi:lysozyme C [Galendromus occidentalis]|uniref:Lysozyme C n=1 Tax=Galendromus occidentalis TaxID=34638 RepID=A0AAJ7L3Y5_9ACAR|nr:lysozyme C [Galendromus occidentalis]
MGIKLIVIWMVSGLMVEVGPRVIDKCELIARLRENLGDKVEDIGQLLCIAEIGSHFNTSVVTKLPDQTSDYGLFQINERYCFEEGNSCGLPQDCESLLTNNVTLAITCASHIARAAGFPAFSVYVEFCSDDRWKRITELFVELDQSDF